MNRLYELKIAPTWAAFKDEGAAFWMISIYILFEYVRPQGIYPWLDILPWAQSSLILAAAFHFLIKHEKLAGDAYTFWMPLFLLVVVISCVTAYHSETAFENLPEVYSWIVVYFIVSSVVNTERRLWIFLLLFFLACAKLSIFCAKVWLQRGFSFAGWGVAGPPGYFQNSGELSLLMTMFFSMSFTFWRSIAKYLNKTRSLIFSLLPITAVMTVLASSSRGSQLALLAQITYLALFYKKLSFRNITLTALAILFLYKIMPAEQLERFSTAGTDKTSTARIVYWKKGYEMLQDHPFTGVGLGNFPVYFHDHYASFSIFKGRLEVAHNSFVQVSSELGYIGLAIFVIIILRSFFITASIRRMLKASHNQDHWIRNFSIGMDCAMLGYLIGGQFMSVAFYPYVWIHCALIVAMKEATKKLSTVKVKAAVRTDASPVTQVAHER